MKTNKKMNMAMAIVCCAAGLVGPAKADVVSEFCKENGLLEICDPDGKRDREILNKINSDTMATIERCNALVERGKSEMAVAQNMPAVLFNQNVSVVPFNQNMPVALINNTPQAIYGIQITPCVTYGVAVPRTLPGWIAPMSGVYTVIGSANAYYNIRFLTNGGVPIDFCDVFIGAGTSKIVLTHVGQGHYMLSRI